MLDGNLRYHNAFLVFPFNKYLKYTDQWVFAPVVDLQYMIALHNEGENITQTFMSWFCEVKHKGLYEDGLLLHKYYQPFYRLNPNWSSGMAQGLLLSCMIRCDCNEIDEQDIQLVVNSLLSGELISDTRFGLFIEEYPHKNPNMVLNGFLFALIGLLEYISVRDSAKKDIFLRRRALEYLETFITSYRFYLASGFNSCYDIQGRVADKTYHLLHIKQLLAVNVLVESIYGISINYIIKQFKQKSIRTYEQSDLLTLRKINNFYHILKFLTRK